MAEENPNKTITAIIYALYASSLLIAVTVLPAIIMNYIKREDVQGTWLESHFTWQIRTFWYSLLWSFIGGVLWPFGIGMIILAANLIWFIYRIVKGWISLADNKAMYPSL